MIVIYIHGKDRGKYRRKGGEGKGQERESRMKWERGSGEGHERGDRTAES